MSENCELKLDGENRDLGFFFWDFISNLPHMWVVDDKVTWVILVVGS